ncbi:MAG: hypothetical protein WAM78_04805 [Candidatus Sulfotelmatobacter sp.]
MDRRKSSRGVRFAWAIVLALTFTLGCADEHRHHEPGIWFVHATDPHIFLDASIKEDKKKIQEDLDEKAVSDMWQRLSSLENGGHTFSFLVLTGDFGVEPCSIADLPATANPTGKESYVAPPAKDCLDHVNSGKHADQVSRLADLLGNSPVPDIYLVAGNNDIASETADDAGLTYFNHLMDEVQRKIDDANKNVHLHNLTRCYSSNSTSSCFADVAGTPYRLIGFPSYSYKNRDTDRKTNTGGQEKQFDKFETLLEQARQSDKKVLVVSHVPLIDDPYTLAQQRYAIPIKIDRDPDSPVSQWSTWNVSKKLSEEWQQVIASDTVAGVLAGHLHDSHKEIYKPPYAWSSVSDPRNGFSKLFMAPPLAVKNQDASPIQARGLAVVGLEPDHIDYSIYWYNSVTGDFAPDKTGYGSARHRWRPLTTAIRWLWQLADPAESLDRMAVLLIALLAAFLTIVQIWQIPPPDDPLAASPKSADDQNAAQKGKGGAKAADPKPAFDPSPFASNFGKTVIAGLGGLAAETVLKSLEGKPTAEDREFYIVWFIIFFFLILFGSAFFRAFGEALRARFAIIYYPLARPPKPKTGIDFFWLSRILHWLSAWQVPLLTFLDTFVNLIQGQNQTMTRVFSDKIVEQQRNVVRTANTIRRQLNEVIRLRLSQLFDPKVPINPEDVRVNISVLSADQSNVFYIARTPGSAVESFPKRSVAWVSVFTGKIRWYRKTYKDDRVHPALYSKIVLYDNQNGAIADDQPTIFLHANYQPRDDDYEAFVMFPFPWPHRAYGSDYMKGAIHISFRHEESFDKLWKFMSTGAEHHQDPVLHSQKHEYENETLMLSDWCDEQIRATLREAIMVLGELLRGFNENIYLSSKKEDQCSEG